MLEMILLVADMEADTPQSQPEPPGDGNGDRSRN